MNMLFEKSFVAVLAFYMKVYSKLTAKPSTDMTEFLISSFIVLSCAEIILSFLKNGFGGLFWLDVFSLPIFLFVFKSFDSLDANEIERAKDNYQPGTVVLIPVQFPHTSVKYQIRKTVISLFMILLVFDLINVPISLLSSEYYLAMKGFLRLVNNIVVIAVYTNTFYYAEASGKTIWAKIKDKIKNRQRAVRLAPMGV